VALEPIVQNTANVSKILGTYNSGIDLNRDRYTILRSAHLPDQPPSTEVYKKDPQAYYPYENPNKEPPKADPSVKLNRGLTYTDKKPYYSPTKDFYLLPLPKQGKVVGIDFEDLQNTFPTKENIDRLKNQLEAMRIKNNFDFQQYLNNPNIYISDPKPYYDTSKEDRDANVKILEDTIIRLQNELDESNKNQFGANVVNEKVTPQIQNRSNREAELHLQKQKELYTQVVIKDGKNHELPHELSNFLPANKNTVTISGDKVDVDVITHDLQEADGNSTGTGDVYYNSKVPETKDMKPVVDMSYFRKNLKNQKMVAPNVHIKGKDGKDGKERKDGKDVKK